MGIQGISDIGQLVRARRRDLGMTQKHAAGLLGVGARFLSELERGKETLEVGKVLQILTGLGFTIEVKGPNNEH